MSERLILEPHSLLGWHKGFQQREANSSGRIRNPRCPRFSNTRLFSRRRGVTCLSESCGLKMPAVRELYIFRTDVSERSAASRDFDLTKN